MAQLHPQKIIIIVGPTASGKSDLAIKLAERVFAKGGSNPCQQGAEIISADSRQVYRGMDIGTGKVSKKEQEFIPHHLIDVSNPKKIFTVSQFKKLSEKAIKAISKKNKIPIIVGGTGQYIDTLVYNLSLPEVPPNYKLRAKLEKQTTEQLFAQIQKLDPERASNIDRHNPRRLIRALEIVHSIGKVPPLNTSPIIPNTRYDILWIGLNPKNLDSKISKRLNARLRQGMIAEVKRLHSQGVSWQRLNDLGLEYRWVGEYLQNKITKEEMVSGLEQAIRQYSKRQMTWFKRNKKINWVTNLNSAVKLTKVFA